jgi:hypothetical protein
LGVTRKRIATGGLSPSLSLLAPRKADSQILALTIPPHFRQNET